MKVWSTYANVEQAVETMVAIKELTGEVPEILIETNRSNLERTKRMGIREYFYRLLLERCPELLERF